MAGVTIGQSPRQCQGMVYRNLPHMLLQALLDDYGGKDHRGFREIVLKMTDP